MSRVRNRRGGRRVTALALPLVVLAGITQQSCAPEEGPGETATFVIARLDFITQPEADGTVRGFNLDQLDHTESSGPEGCFRGDFVSPEGERGVDNQLSRIGASLVVFANESVSTIVQGAVNDGLLLVIAQIGDLHDWRNDPHVTLRFRLGMGPVDVGTDSHLVPGQSFDPRPNYQFEATQNARIEDGVLIADGATLTLPIQILGVDLDFPILHGHAEFELDASEYTLTGRLGGQVPATALDELSEQIYIASGMDEALQRLVLTAFRGIADLAPRGDGTCERFSAAMDVDGVRAFVLEPAAD